MRTCASLLVLVLALAGCSAPEPGPRAGPRWDHTPWEYDLEVAGTQHRARVERLEPREVDGALRTRHRVHELEPHPRVVDGASLAWLFTLLEPEADLLSGERTIPHPDREVVARLVAETRGRGVGAVSTWVPALLRLESRAQVLLAAGEAGPPEDLLDALAPEAPLFRATPEGLAPGGNEGACRRELLLSVVRSPALGTAVADRAAQEATRVGRDAYALELLEALVGRASVQALVAASTRLRGADERRALLLRLAAQPLLPDEAELLASAAPGIAWDPYERELLLALIGKVGPETILREAAHLYALEDRRAVLQRLSAEPLDPAQADRLARAAPSLGWDPEARELLESLIGRASPEALRAAAARLGAEERARLLDALER